jgi:hypothetical protein
VAKLVARLLATVILCRVLPYYGNSLDSNPDVSQKYKMGDISKGVANTL